MTDKQRQCLLAYLGYYSGNIDGIFGTLSKAALKSFQKDYGGIAVDGIAGSESDKAMKYAVSCGMPARKDESAASGDFWDDIKYFKRSEFKCKCGNIYCNGYPAEPQETLIRAADKVREHFGKPMHVSSGLRCTQHNKNVGGVSNSRHLSGKAMDYSVSGFSADMILAYVKQLPEIRYAYAIDSIFVHMDIK